MRRLALLVAGTAAVVVVAVTLRSHDKPETSRPSAVPPPTGPTTVTGPTEPTGPTSSPNPVHYRAGTVTGDRAHTDYGDVRVRVTVARHRIVRVEAVELPHGNPMDLQVSRPAVRTLERRVVQAQSSDVDTVSGATYTSIGYLTSLQSALDQLA
jgi:uncharacterized protein with FMN-binding domain